ncbi:uncharacterized protein EKO05_0000559 [Ascochyta rabiei]|uniref:uncharacterized protein n=1 Tax=Didymella rabiei TaxID=5454 RepID=UPI00220548A3|nr:uncharacterized protein EKO05_0000559 [Ascochyta rabiei]UPX09879.1 hypothetical protein EKO05_0000559 [Ascochyta rabiei]
MVRPSSAATHPFPPTAPATRHYDGLLFLTDALRGEETKSLRLSGTEAMEVSSASWVSGNEHVWSFCAVTSGEERWRWMVNGGIGDVCSSCGGLRRGHGGRDVARHLLKC